MKQKALQTSPAYFQHYIDLVDDKPLSELLEEGGIDLYLDDAEKLEKLGDYRYAEGKWTVKELIEHLIDCERIFQNRALRFLRKDQTELPGFEENDYVAAARSNDRSVESLLEEFQLVRLSTAAMYRHLNEEELLRTGKANGNEMSVLAIGYVLVGHPIHHFNVIRERYFSNR